MSLSTKLQKAAAGLVVAASFGMPPARAADDSKPGTGFGHPLIPDMLADVSIVELDGTFYCFATTDAEDRRVGRPTVWQSKDFANWSFKGSIFPDDVKYDFEYWAPSVPVFRNGVYHLFPTFA